MLAPLFAAGVFSVQAQVQTNSPPTKPKAKWESSAAAGLTLTRGNSSSTLATLSATTDGKWDQSELSLGADATYGRTKSPGQTTATTSAELLHGFVQYNWLFTERFYGYGRVEGLHDGVADIKYRVSLSPGVGYYFIKTTNTDLSAEAGPGYIFQELGNDTSSYAVLRLGEKFHQALSDRARLWQTAEVLPQVDRFSNYIINAEIGIEADLTRDKKFALRSYVTDTFNNEPAPGRQKNDVTWVTAIAYKF
jgi:putative salt-induced outer membrane protein